MSNIFNVPETHAVSKKAFNTYSITKNVFIYSKDRDWSQSEKPTFKYNIAFGADTSNSNASIVKVFRNIKSISIDEIIIPNLYCNLTSIHGAKANKLIQLNNNTSQKNNRIVNFERLVDLPFITMRINEIGNTQYGTNDQLNNAVAVLVLDTEKYCTNNNAGSITYTTGTSIDIFETGNYGGSLIPGNGMSNVIYRNITDKKIYFPSIKGILPGLSISFYKPSGEEIQLLNDTVSISSCEYYNTTACVVATTENLNVVSYSGTATAGASDTITLASGSSVSNDFYNTFIITITGGTGNGQTRNINDYVGSSLVATVDEWATTPDNTSVYTITGISRLEHLDSHFKSALSIDGIAINSGDRVLVKNQTDSIQNGIYTLTTVGSASVNWILTRAALELRNKTLITSGATHNDNTFVLTNTTAFTSGTDQLQFIEQMGLKIITNEYFSPEEYKVGDVIIFNNCVFSANTNDKLKLFLERREGHVIIAIEDNATTPLTNQTFFNAIIIGVKYNINDTTGNIVNDSFGITNAAIPLFSGGSLLNLNNQHLIKMSIETEHYREEFNSQLL